jgi:hypothetical protein
MEGIDLILHQSYERGDYNGKSWQEESQKLKAERFSSPRWQKRKSIPACKDLLHDLPLKWAECIKSEDLLE